MCFNSIQILKETSVCTKQTVEKLIRRCILLRLIWDCTVCLCPTKRTLDLNGLMSLVRAYKFTMYLSSFFISPYFVCLQYLKAHLISLVFAYNFFCLNILAQMECFGKETVVMPRLI